MAETEARIARALNPLAEDAFLFSSNGDSLLDLIYDYFDDAAPAGKKQPNLLN